MNEAECLSLYQQHHRDLVRLAVSRFGMSRDAADNLAFDVCLSALHASNTIVDPRHWLVGAMTCATRAVMRSRG